MNIKVVKMAKYISNSGFSNEITKINPIIVVAEIKFLMNCPRKADRIKAISVTRRVKSGPLIMPNSAGKIKPTLKEV